MRNLLLTLTLLAPCPTFASGFAGHWSASAGKVTGPAGIGGACTKIEIELAEQPGQLTVTRYHSECGLYGSTWGPDVMTIKDGKVYEDEDEVGTLTGDTLMTISHDGGVDYAFNLKLLRNADGSETLESYYGVRNGAGAMATEANLARTAR